MASNFDTANRLKINGATYDNGAASGNGNQTAIGGYAYTYDAENRMVNAALSAGATLLSSAAYVYDGLGQRVQKMTCNTSNPCTASAPDATVTTYVYDAFGNLAQEYGPSPMSWCGTPTCYLTQDQVGSTRLVTDANGLVDTRYDYLPFGEELFAGTGGRMAPMGYAYFENYFNPKFTGQMRDPESARDLMGFRYYSPQEGRFVSVDPGNAGADATVPQTWNGYAYVGNNPLNYTDSSGLFIEAPVGCAAGPVGCVVGSAVAGLGALFGWLFGGGGPSVPNWSTTVWALGPSQTTPGVGIESQGGAIGADIDPSVLVIPGLVFTAEATAQALWNSLSSIRAARFQCAAAGSEALSLNAGLGKLLAGVGYNPNNFFAGALFGSTTATISNLITGPDRITNAGQLAVNSPLKWNGVNTVQAAIGKIPTSGMGTVQLAADSGGRFFGISEQAATLAGKGAFKTVSKAIGWAAVAGLAWDIGTYAVSYYRCGGAN